MAPAIGGQHSCRNGDYGADNQCEESELERCGIAFKNNLAHRRLKLERLPKVAASELPQVVSVLRMKRQIQPKYVAQLSQLPGAAPSPNICSTGSPGTTWIMRKTSVRTSQRAGSVRRNRLRR